MAKQTKMLLAGDYPLIASPTFAKKYGLAAATFVQKLHYCLQQSSLTTEYRNKRYWHHTLQQWADSIGFYSIGTIRRAIDKLIHEGIVMVCKLSQNKWVQTNYYTICYERIKVLFDMQSQPVENTEPMTPQQAKHSNDNKASHGNGFLKTAVKKVLGVARENKPVSAAVYQVESQLIGTDQPTCKLPKDGDLTDWTIEQKTFYGTLLQCRVDVAFDDPRLAQWQPYAAQIIQHIAGTRDGHGGIARYQWHTPEMLSLERFTV